MSLYVLQLSRMWFTVCRPSPQSHPGSSTSGTLLFYRKSLSLIFSVRIWMSRALCHFFRPQCSRMTWCDGCRVCLNAVLPLVSALQLFIHSALVILDPDLQDCLQVVCLCLYDVLVPLASCCFLFGCSLGCSICSIVSPDATMGWYPPYLGLYLPISLKFVYEFNRVSYDVCT